MQKARVAMSLSVRSNEVEADGNLMCSHGVGC